MLMGLIEYSVNFFNAEHINQVLTTVELSQREFVHFVVGEMPI